MARPGARLAPVAALGLLLGVVVALSMLPGGPVRLGGRHGEVAVGEARVGGPFELVDHTGSRVTDADFRGRILLVFFGFSRSRDVTPAALQVMAAATEMLGAEGDRVALLLVTVDPEHDTPERLAAFRRSFHPRLVGLTGSAAEIRAIAKAYHVHIRREAGAAPPDDATLEHTTLVYLMDQTGRYVDHFPHVSPAREIAAAIGRLLR